jgi:hypothetical protein
MVSYSDLMVKVKRMANVMSMIVEVVVEQNMI